MLKLAGYLMTEKHEYSTRVKLVDVHRALTTGDYTGVAKSKVEKYSSLDAPNATQAVG